MRFHILNILKYIKYIFIYLQHFYLNILFVLSYLSAIDRRSVVYVLYILCKSHLSLLENWAIKKQTNHGLYLGSAIVFTYLFVTVP